MPTLGAEGKLLTTALDRQCGPYPPIRGPLWNGDRLVFAVENGGNVHLYSAAADGSARPELLVGGELVIGGYDVRGDGLVYVAGTHTTMRELYSGRDGKQLTNVGKAFAEGRELSEPERFTATSQDGTEVDAWIVRPPGFDPARKYPLVYLVHGGPQGAWTDYWGARWNYAMFAARGYVVAAVNFHGSTGYGQKFTDAISQHWGDYPFEDVMKGLDVVARLPYVDSTRMGAAGASYGGYMIYWLAGHTDRFKVLVDHDGVFDPVSMAGTTEELWFVDWEFGGTPYANRALYEKWSPLNFVPSWKTPMLIVHSQLDYRVDLSEGYQAFTALKARGVPAKFLYFPDEGHWVLKPRNRRVWWSTVLDWLDQYLKPTVTGAR